MKSLYRILIAMVLLIALGRYPIQAGTTKLPPDKTTFNDRWRKSIAALSDSLRHRPLTVSAQHATLNKLFKNNVQPVEQSVASADSFHLVWSASYAPQSEPSLDSATALVRDSHDGSIYAAGNTSLGYRTSIYLVKLNAGGDTLWSRMLHSYAASNDQLVALSIDSSEYIFAVMYSADPDSGGASFLIKISPSGNEMWHVKLSITGIGSTTVDHHGNFVFVGDGAVAKYAHDGFPIWYNIVPQTGINCVAMDSLDNTYLGAALTGATSVLMVKYDPLGNAVFQQDRQLEGWLNSLTLCDDGSSFALVTGFGTEKLFRFDPAGNQQWVVDSIPSATELVCTHLGDRCLLIGGIIAEYDTAGVRLFEHPRKSAAFTGIAVDPLSNIFLSGLQYDSVDLRTNYVVAEYNAAGDSLTSVVYERKSSSPGPPALVPGDGGDYYLAGSDDFGAANDFLVVKFRANGHIDWQYVYNQGFTSNVSVFYTLSDKIGNVYFGGTIEDANGIDDFLVAKYDSNGRFQWASRYALPGAWVNYTGPMVIDDSGNVYVAGFSEAAVYEMVTMKFNPFGGMDWHTAYLGPDRSGELPTTITLDNNQQPLVLGTTASGENIDLVKYDRADGHEEWATLWTGPMSGPDDAVGVTVDHAGDIYVVGNTLNYYDKGAIMEVATIKYNSAGLELWQRIYPPGEAVASYSLDARDNITVVGLTTPYVGVAWGTAIIAYSSVGDTLWTSNFGGQIYGYDRGAKNPPAGSIADDSGNTVVAVTGDSLVIWKYAPNGQVLWTLRDSGDGISRLYRGSHGDFYYLLALGGYSNLEHYDFNGHKLENGIQLPWTPSTISQSGDFIFGSTVVSQGNGIALAEYRRAPSAIEGVKISQALNTFKLMQNYPNPFNPTTRIDYSLSSASNVTITLYNVLGQPVATLVNAVQSAGNKSADWNGASFASGVYFYKIEATPLSHSGQDFVDVKKLVLIR